MFECLVKPIAVVLWSYPTWAPETEYERDLGQDDWPGCRLGPVSCLRRHKQYDYNLSENLPLTVRLAPLGLPERIDKGYFVLVLRSDAGIGISLSFSERHQPSYGKTSNHNCMIYSKVGRVHDFFFASIFSMQFRDVILIHNWEHGMNVVEVKRD